MALTRDQIINAEATLDDVTKELYLVLFKSNEVYIKNAILFSVDVQERLDNASGTIKGRMLNALMKKIDALGTGNVKIRGDKDAVHWSQSDERNDLITEALRVLFEDSVEGLTPTDDFQGYVNTSVGLYGSIAVGQRPLPSDKCTQFMCRCGSC